MNKPLLLACFIFAFVISVFLFPDGAVAALLCSFLSFFVILAILKTDEGEKGFLINIFLAGLLVRVTLATLIYVFEWQNIFGPDAATYDIAGNRILSYWLGKTTINAYGVEYALSMTNTGWGMKYLVAVIYAIVGRNPLAAQFFCCVLGAATSVALYICSRKIFRNLRAAKTAALLAAFFPSMIIWSSQLLKDGVIIFFLVMIMVALINLHEKLNYLSLVTMIFSLTAILSLRFYIFYMMVAAVVGSFVVGVSGSNQSLIRRLVILLVIGTALTYIGASRSAQENVDQFGSLERLQQSRRDQAVSAESGYGKDIDVSTSEGVIAVLPIGFLFLMFAPFPWDIGSLSKTIIVPETLLWYASMPLLVKGLFYAIKNRLRSSIAILIFTLMLTVAYSIFQANVGTAYRQRTQIQVFLFIFIAVGWSLYKEQSENKNINVKHKHLLRAAR